MACFRRMYCDWRKNGNCDVENQDLVCLHIFSYHGVSPNHLFRSRFLVKYQTLYSFSQKESRAVFVIARIIFTELPS
jgi:hypothetical protein